MSSPANKRMRLGEDAARPLRRPPPADRTLVDWGHVSAAAMQPAWLVKTLVHVPDGALSPGAVQGSRVAVQARQAVTPTLCRSAHAHPADAAGGVPWRVRGLGRARVSPLGALEQHKQAHRAAASHWCLLQLPWPAPAELQRGKEGILVPTAQPVRARVQRRGPPGPPAADKNRLGGPLPTHRVARRAAWCTWPAALKCRRWTAA